MAKCLIYVYIHPCTASCSWHKVECSSRYSEYPKQAHIDETQPGATIATSKAATAAAL
jgi:hypothetical protein